MRIFGSRLYTIFYMDGITINRNTISITLLPLNMTLDIFSDLNCSTRLGERLLFQKVGCAKRVAQIFCDVNSKKGQDGVDATVSSQYGAVLL